ncbi:mucin-2-like [Anopheles ziemanni]|uniref:mucin-2-like n=1 Tax=Anopheles coustani TaxID=139045 RepID=UPI002659ADE7|nr:mucin-2-like [Anopheles coustani]XP_058169541.1 mucin-2-like [Anopheles ziemanni]
MLIQLFAPYLALFVGSIGAGYVTVPLQSPAGVTYVNSQQHIGLLAGPVRYTSSAAVSPVSLVDARSGAVAVTPGPSPTYYSYNVQPQAVFGKASYTPAVQYHHTSYGSPTVRVYEPKSFVYGVQANNVPSTHTVHTVPVSVSTTQYHHHTPEQVPVTPAPHHPTIAVPVPTPVPVHVPVHVPVPVPVTPTYTKTVTTGPTYVTPQEKPIVPVVRSRKFKVRRPAIQNQFYDIEERVIIRPVGSALVELEQPISQTETQSKTTKTTTTTFVEKRPPVYIPAPPPPPPPPQEEVHPQGDSGYGTRIGRPRVVTQTTTVYTERPQVVVQKNTYDRVRVSSQESTQSAASTSKSSDAEFIDTSANVPQQRPFFTQGHAIYHPQQTAYVPHHYATNLGPHPLLYHPGNAGHLLHHVAYQGQHHALVAHPGAVHPGFVYHQVPSTTPLYPVTPVGPTAPGSDCDREAKAPEYLPPTQTTPVATTTTKPPTSSSVPVADAEEEYDDSIVVDARSGAGQSHDTDYEDSTAYEEAVGSSSTSTTTVATPTYRQHDKYRGEEESHTQSPSRSQSQERSSIEISYATRTTPASDIVAFDPSTSAGVFNLGPSPTAFRGSFSTTTPLPTTISLDAGSSSIASSTPQRSVTIISSTTPRTVSARFSETDDSVTAGRLESSSTSGSISSQSVVVGQGLTQEQIHTNQEQFIKLLSERDSIAEVGFGPGKGDTSSTLIDAYVRSRVLSATPAPRDAKETSRTVNIRRIVVSRPVETEQEVEVREQGYATTVSPPSYEHKRDVSEVSTGRSDAASDESQQPPVYVNAKPPAFADDSNKK